METALNQIADALPLRPQEAAGQDLLLTNARVVTADEDFLGTVQVIDGTIAAVDRGRTAVPTARDLEGDLLIPGLIDIHTDNLESHLEPRPGVHWPTLGALLSHDSQIAGAGITTVFDSLYVGGGDTMKDMHRGEALLRAFEALHFAQEDGLLKADHLLHLRCELGWELTADELEKFVDDKIVRLVSVMDHTPGQRQWSDLDKWRRFNSRKFTTAELDEIIGVRLANQARYADGNRRRIVGMCKARGLPLATHDDTTVEHVLQSSADGIAISEFPCSMDAARLAKEKGMATVMGAPNVVKGGSHSGNVAAHELAESGLLDGLASDYVPISMLHAAIILHERHGHSLAEAVATITGNLARMVGLDDRGEIAPGKRGDLVRVRNYHHMPAVRAVWRAGVHVA